jgi:D-amino peptidase
LVEDERTRADIGVVCCPTTLEIVMPSAAGAPLPGLRLLLPAFCAVLAACSGGKTSTADDSARTAGTPAGDPVTLTAPSPRRDSAIRVLVYHDMEGLSGQDDYRTFNYSHPEYYTKGQEWLAADINAVVDGLFAGGATSVEIVDAHGSGNPSPDLIPEKLDKRATQLTRDSSFRQYVDIVEPDRYDAVVAVGMHAKTGSGGFASHTYTLGMDLLLNGRSITETELVAMSWGRAGVPVIFVSGDDRLAGDLATMPWINYVVTKHATSASTAHLLDVDSVHAEMRAKAADAVRKLADARVMTVNTPVRAALRVVPPASLAMLRGVPGITLSANGSQVDFEAADFMAAYDGLVALMGVARLSYPQVQAEVVRAHRDSTAIQRAQRERLMGDGWTSSRGDGSRPPPPRSPGHAGTTARSRTGISRLCPRQPKRKHTRPANGS